MLAFQDMFLHVQSLFADLTSKNENALLQGKSAPDFATSPYAAYWLSQ